MMSSNKSNNNNNNRSGNNNNNNNNRSGSVHSQMFAGQLPKNEQGNHQPPTTSYLHRQLSSGVHHQQQHQQFHYQHQSMQGGENHVQAAMSGHGNPSPICSGCHRAISERYLLRALDQHWHEDCLKCNACECRLGEVGSILYQKANQILCKRDYLRMFGKIGTCAVCQKRIEAYEMVMKAHDNNYHLDCFSCSTCNHRFCVGDKFSLIDNRIFCEYDALLLKGSPVGRPPNPGKASTSK